MLHESVGFAYDINHWHSQNTPGQGTRNMTNFPFILKYALATSSIAAQARALAAGNTTDPVTQNKVRALVLSDALSFASAMWYYKRSGEAHTGCTALPGMAAGLQSATTARLGAVHHGVRGYDGDGGAAGGIPDHPDVLKVKADNY
ncbi:hypothetical protein B0H15DRAFT_186506 [Mycena belliarum]|uniref:Uncharacterized protein n=1 Tax=Mycena belliarum TaxID=1033014 RepID=A0AAD6U985_9AGAR|nr:hypothetical protein B0H15DRAFT_186506 [Mycena belliae]